ncbi:MAG TPA: hypothetical protein VIJ92_16115 [Ginsengibacter sp.]
MQKILTTILLTLSLTSYGQKGKFNPFKLIVLKPDTAIIDKSLYSDRDSVEVGYLRRYYHGIEQLQQIADAKYHQNDTSFVRRQKEYKAEIVAEKAMEPEIKKFKYYQTLSTYSTEVYNFYFNEYEPFSEIIELPNQVTDIASLSKLADTSKADYVVFFSNVHSEVKDGLPILKLTTSLYSKKDNKIILTKETEGDANSRGDMWTCDFNVPLSCLLINGVKTSTDEIAPIIAKAQLRH